VEWWSAPPRTVRRARSSLADSARPRTVHHWFPKTPDPTGLGPLTWRCHDEQNSCGRSVDLLGPRPGCHGRARAHRRGLDQRPLHLRGAPGGSRDVRGTAPVRAADVDGAVHVADRCLLRRVRARRLVRRRHNRGKADRVSPRAERRGAARRRPARPGPQTPGPQRVGCGGRRPDPRPRHLERHLGAPRPADARADLGADLRRAHRRRLPTACVGDRLPARGLPPQRLPRDRRHVAGVQCRRAAAGRRPALRPDRGRVRARVGDRRHLRHLHRCVLQPGP
jgi:hypothetical protein